MISKLIQIGTSKGIRIPKVILDQCNILENDQLELSVHGNAITIKPIKKKACDTWVFEGSTVLTHEEKDWLELDEKTLDQWEWK